ncbi:MAG: transglutaminase-like domain-containing protein [Acidimicrobiia bacterium]
MDVARRFDDVVQRAESSIALDEACFLIAAHAHPDVDVDARCEQLDALAASLGADDAGALAHALFAELGFAGNTVDYGDPNNSYLDAVLDRRLGIPITLSVLMIEIGRRLGIAVHGVGMPGHFLVGAGASEWYDPFNGGIRLDDMACAERFAEIQGRAAFHRDYLAPVGPLAILDRMLANLQHSLIERDPARAAWPTRLRLRIPGISPARRAELAALLGSLGQFSEAATELDAVAREIPGAGSEQVAQAAARFRARAN